MSARPVIYIAAPYSHPDPCENTHTAIRFADLLMDAHLCWPLVPHLSHLWHTVRPRKYEDWIALDLALLERCDGLIRLPGGSTGADGEVALARELDLPVIHILRHDWTTESMGEVIASVRRWVIDIGQVAP